MRHRDTGRALVRRRIGGAGPWLNGCRGHCARIAASRASRRRCPRIVLARRLARGKEHPQRLAERRGETRIARPPGPLIWAHGASVGEMLAVIPLVEGVRARNFNVLVTSGTVTSARLAEERLPPNVIHQFVPLDTPRYTARFLDHWQPNLCAARRIRPVAEPDHGLHRKEHPAHSGERPPLGALVHALALSAAHDQRAARAFRSVSHAVRRRTRSAIPSSARRASA
jgi:hypothetical protein